MKTVLILAVGIWIGRELSKIHAENLASEGDLKIRKQLENFLHEHLPSLSPPDMKRQVDKILKG